MISNVLDMPAVVSYHPYLVLHSFSYLVIYCSRYPLHTATSSYSSTWLSAQAFQLTESCIHLPYVSLCCDSAASQLILSFDQLLTMRLTNSADRVSDNFSALKRSVSKTVCCDASEVLVPMPFQAPLTQSFTPHAVFFFSSTKYTLAANCFPLAACGGAGRWGWGLTTARRRTTEIGHKPRDAAC